jgi:hypothetical protein
VEALDADVVWRSEGANGAAQGTATIKRAKRPVTIRFVETGGRVLADGGGGRDMPPPPAGVVNSPAVLLRTRVPAGPAHLGLVGPVSIGRTPRSLTPPLSRTWSR